MNKDIARLENCLKEMRRCLKIPNVENCICFSDAFKVLDFEAKRSGLSSIQKEIEKVKRIISKGKKECIGCSPCIASSVFSTYPETLNILYSDDKL